MRQRKRRKQDGREKSGWDSDNDAHLSCELLERRHNTHMTMIRWKWKFNVSHVEVQNLNLCDRRRIICRWEKDERRCHHRRQKKNYVTTLPTSHEHAKRRRSMAKFMALFHFFLRSNVFCEKVVKFHFIRSTERKSERFFIEKTFLKISSFAIRDDDDSRQRKHTHEFTLVATSQSNLNRSLFSRSIEEREQRWETKA